MDFKAKLELIELIKTFGSNNRLLKEAELNDNLSAEKMWRNEKNENLDKIIDIISNL